MDPTDRLSALMALMLEHLADVEVRQEVILRTQAHYLGAVLEQDWSQIYADLERQVREGTDARRQKLLAEFRKLQGLEPKGDSPG